MKSIEQFQLAVPHVVEVQVDEIVASQQGA